MNPISRQACMMFFAVGKKLLSEQIAVIFLFLLLANPSFSQNEKNRKISVLPVPAVGYSPETKTYVGAVTLFTIKNLADSATRSSNAKIELNYTWKKQLILETGWNYFFPDEKWFTRGLFHFSKYPDLYYGIGVNSPGTAEIIFQSNRKIVDFDVLRNILNNRFIGAGFNFTSYSNIDNLSDSLFYGELTESAKLGAKLIFLKDSRNNILSPSKGNYFEFNTTVNFSSELYVKTTVDYRHYLELGKNGQNTLAGRFYHSGIFGNPPFYDYSKIGGDKFVRGYFSGRFLEKNMSTFQIEFRNPLFWRVGMATFGGISMLYKKMGAIGSESFKPNVGLGLRFLVDKKENTNLRVDYAVGSHGQSGFYISFGESF